MTLLHRLSFAALLITSVATQAAPVLADQSVALQASKTGTTQTGTFKSVHTVAGEFIDTFTLTGVDGWARINASLTTLGSTQAVDIDFVSATLNGVAYSFNRSLLGANPDGVETGSFINTLLSTPLVLTVHGYAGAGLAAGSPINASYSGTFNVTQVPEPASLTLAVAGLIGVGVSRRRRAA
ncbi:FxDxF family PEP-CTERM protein [Roseateles terrae]|uniref:Ice-binding protein C-terminal domain-containing protein n=1 Tax=Roseateles terrae TaxID=431060 RepID=A0ABR6GY78_9BURK|nr:FxDxF family PEP-CTERM protein [Roseateles terrae]MBB3197063.1 hypothetical protein [Roseateles terrae]OWQ84225.1 hypothetical protein CDN98_19790 [Roseateles terrae]